MSLRPRLALVRLLRPSADKALSQKGVPIMRFITIAGSFLAYFFLVVSCSSTGVPPAETQGSVLNDSQQSGNLTSASKVREAISAPTVTPMSKASSVGPPKKINLQSGALDGPVFAGELKWAYNNDPIGANDLYTGKELLVTGRIGKISLEPGGDFSTYFGGLSCAINKKDSLGFRDITGNELITVKGTVVVGKEGGPNLEDCAFDAKGGFERVTPAFRVSLAQLVEESLNAGVNEVYEDRLISVTGQVKDAFQNLRAVSWAVLEIPDTLNILNCIFPRQYVDEMPPGFGNIAEGQTVTVRGKFRGFYTKTHRGDKRDSNTFQYVEIRLIDCMLE